MIRPDNRHESIDFQSISTVDEIDYREKLKPAISAPNSEVEDGGKAKRRKLKLIEIKTRALCPKEDNGGWSPTDGRFHPLIRPASSSEEEFTKPSEKSKDGG